MASFVSGATTTISLIEYAKGLPETNPTRIFVENMVRESDLMMAVPFRPATAGKVEFVDIASTPTVNFRGINENAGEALGTYNLRTEDTFFIDEYVKYDRALADRMGPDGEAKQVELKTIALAQMFTASFIKSDNTLNPRTPNGLQVRCGQLITNASVGGNLFHNSALSGGGPLSLLNLDIVQACVNRPTHWIMPRGLKPFFHQAARSATLTNNAVMYSNEGDPLGRKVMMYNGLPILWGYEPDDTPDMLPFNEVAAGGGGAVTSSVYCISLRDGGVYGIEQTALQVTPEGQLAGAPARSTHIKWDWGIAREHPRSVARLTSITAAAIVA